MFSSVLSAAILGVDANPVCVEADISDGLPCFTIVGYVTSQVKEAQERVRTALRNIGIILPPKRITINLAPADIRKDGSRFDLPVAASILAAAGRIPPDCMENTMVAGELSLDGGIRGVTGILPIVIRAREMGCHTCIIPRKNGNEGSMVDGIQVVAVESLGQFIAYCRSKKIPNHIVKKQKTKNAYDVDFSEIRGQEAVKRAALIAAAGFHNLLLIGPPGSGKTMIAKRIPTILPEMTAEERLEVTKIHSVAGLLPESSDALHMRPFRAPHHTVSAQALAGGGLIPRPGEVTLAHRGILFIDELSEVSKRSLEILRQPLEDREITISRTYGTFRFPAAFMMIAAINPCGCGYYPDLNRCSCTPALVSRYVGKISQPLLDRIDLCTEAPSISYEDLQKKNVVVQNSEQMRELVMKAHAFQQCRYREEEINFNSELRTGMIERYCPIEEKGQKLLERAFDKMRLSARVYHRIIKVARTIADLEESSLIKEVHISEAICYRSIDKKFWRI